MRKESEAKYDFHFFQNKDCRYFPCHASIPITDFNCIHCYCPLHFVPDCGGDPRYTDSGVRDCSGCTKPHDKQGWTWIRDRINEEVGNTKRFSEVTSKGKDEKTLPSV